ncbi:unnamed protein product [Durusdinium trenchii]|uniref:Uncharacterized protein n=3 Tax=Durusdinium trenchii TaxID=1381693 RepID=A0ABP0SG58_9DINO
MVKRHVKGGKARKTFGPKTKTKPQLRKPKCVIQNAKATSPGGHASVQKDVQMSATPVQAQKADKAQKLSRKQRKKIRLESETSVKPQASPKSRAAASPKAKAAVPSPKMAPEQMDIDVEKSKKQRRKEQRRSIQVKKTQMKKKGNY